MKLRNKRTGEIAEPFGITCINGRTFVQFDDGKGTFKFEARSLSELNEEWEDYEEPKDKGYWYIDDLCRMRYSSELLDEIDDRPNNWMIRKLCGNYFDTREEAEKAVHKLQAWKRLKDKGFRFDGYDSGHNSNKELCGQAYFKAGNFWFDIKADLDLLFGGEE